MRRARLQTVYTGAVGRKMGPKPWRARNRVHKRVVKCIDGPWRGHGLCLSDGPADTLPIVIRGQSGRYVGGKWVA